MTIVDANLLLYAYNASSEHHESSAKWLEHLLNSGEPVAVPWLSMWAFVRVSTNPRTWPAALGPKEAFASIRAWISHPSVVVLQPGPRHAEILERLVTETSAVGAMVTDAVLAALAIENGATLASADYDFRRFPGLKWLNPLA
jgi:toxin-antitoxin system PIN domain toxin